MNNRMSVFVVVGALGLAGAMALPMPLAHATIQPETKLSLHDEMEGMKDALRTIGRNHNDESKRADVLAAITSLQEHTLASKALTPDKVEKMPEADQEAAIVDYRVRMAMVLGLTTELEVAYLDGEHDKVDDIIRNKLFDIRDAGHAEFQEDH